jgi:speckle-type POZ protein
VARQVLPQRRERRQRGPRLRLPLSGRGGRHRGGDGAVRVDPPGGEPRRVLPQENQGGAVQAAAEVRLHRPAEELWGYPKFTKRDAMQKLDACKGDSFIIRCQLIVINSFRTEEKGAPKAKSRAYSVPVPPPDLHQHLGHLLETKKGSDVVFDVGGETFSAHRFVLAARSPVFAAEFFSEMKESDAAGVVRIDDMEPGVFQALLCFAYTDSLPEMKKGKEDAMYQHLLVAADRYGMERLKLTCEDKLCKCIDVSRAATILTLAEQHQCDGLKKVCLHFLKAPANLRAVIASDGFEHLGTSCPSIKKDLLGLIAS